MKYIFGKTKRDKNIFFYFWGNPKKILKQINIELINITI